MPINDIKISIIMPMYNVEQYISESIQSVLAQSVREFELIIIDDNSSDKSYEIAAAYAEQDQRIVLLKQTIEKGASTARNYGLRMASGEYLFFLDADDLMVRDTLKILLNTAIREQADLVIAHHETFNEQMKELAWIYDEFPSLKQSGGKNIIVNPELFQLPYCWGKLFKKDLIKNNTFPQNIIFGEDQVFVAYAYLNAKKIYLVDSVLYGYRRREGQVTQSTYISPATYVTDIIQVFELVRDHFVHWNGDEKIQNNLYGYYVNSYLFRNLFSFLASGLLSDDQCIQLSVLQKYKEWVYSINPSVYMEICDSLKDINFRISKMLSVFDKDVQDSCRDLFSALDKKDDEIDQLKGFEMSSVSSFKKNPKITIQTVAYNVEHFIRECAESVLNQSFTDFEWIVLDNGSTDKTRDILNEYALKDRRIKLFSSERNSITNNEELNSDFVKYVYDLKTDYWCVLDSDDLLHQDFLYELYNAAINNNADIAVGGSRKFFEADVSPPELRLCPDFYIDNISDIGEIFPSIYFMFSVYWGKLVKSSLLIDVFRFQEKNSLMLKHTNDTLFGLVLLKLAKSVVGVNKPLYHYRIRANSYYNSFIDPKRYLDYVFIYQKNKELLLDWNQLNTQNHNFIVDKLFFSILNCIDIISKSKTLSLREKLQGIEAILSDKFLYGVFAERGILDNMIAETQKMMKVVMDSLPDSSLLTALEHYIFRLFKSIEMFNSSRGNKNNALLMYLSSIVDINNKNNFGSVFVYPFLSVLNLRIFSGIEKLGVTAGFLTENVVLLRNLVNSRFDYAMEICEENSGHPQYDLLKQYLKQENLEIDLLKLEHDKHVMLTHFNREQVDDGIEVLLNVLERCPLDREALIYKLRLVAANNDLITAVETVEVLKAFYPDDIEISDLLNQIRELTYVGSN
ncbi:glycosyltransferase family 2 protein [Paenibacillus sp. NPDC057934]|uniref:glycosyltransferase family 2 protein n=1 Tax=Paenibacillus sp. NPDC057934 TaxID=3346282 RepID=UPI0036DB78E6